MKTVNIILFGNINLDSRVKRIISSMQYLGFNVTLTYYGKKITVDLPELRIVNIKLYCDILPKGGRFAIFKYLELIIRTCILRGKYNIIYCNDLFTLPTGVISKLLKRTNFLVYDAHDDQINNAFNSILRRRICFYAEKVFLRYVDLFLTVNDSLLNIYQNRYNLSCECRRLRNIPKITVSKKNTFQSYVENIRSKYKVNNLYLWHGYFSRHRGIEKLLHTAQSNVKDYSIIFVGEGQLQVEIERAANLSNNIFCYQAIELSELIGGMYLFDAGLFTYSDHNANYNNALPNKYFEYLSGGLPVITVPLKVICEDVKKKEVGIVASGFDNESINEALKTEKHHLYKLKKNVYQYQKKLSWDYDFDRIKNLLK